MLAIRNRINYLNIVLVLFSLINFFELFLPRDDSQQSSARLPIQILNLVVLFFMGYFLTLHRIHTTNISRVVKLMILMVFGYFMFYLVQNQLVVSEITTYIKFVTWLLAIIFFFEVLVVLPLNNTFFQLYVLTFILATAKKIFESSLFDSEKLGGGDTASLPLLFIIPITLLVFKDKYRAIVLMLCTLLILISLRRTSILALVLSLPFIFRYLKTALSPLQVVLIAVVFVVAIVFAWQVFGAAIEYRLLELVDNKTDNGYGSGRGKFYVLVWEEYLKGNISVFFGNGLTSVRKLLTVRVESALTHAHNDYLEIIYTFGLLGLSLWFFFLKSIWDLRKNIKRYIPINVNVFYITFISLLIISISSGSILRVEMVAFSINLSLLHFLVFKEKYNLNIR